MMSQINIYVCSTGAEAQQGETLNTPSTPTPPNSEVQAVESALGMETNPKPPWDDVEQSSSGRESLQLEIAPSPPDVTGENEPFTYENIPSPPDEQIETTTSALNEKPEPPTLEVLMSTSAENTTPSPPNDIDYSNANEEGVMDHEATSPIPPDFGIETNLETAIDKPLPPDD